MPIYDYECQRCGHVFDVLQKLSDPPPAKCPGCGAAGVRKLLSAPAFQVKGSAGSAAPTRTRSGHNLDGAHGHSHDHGHSHSHGHTHSHGGGSGKCGCH